MIPIRSCLLVSIIGCLLAVVGCRSSSEITFSDSLVPYRSLVEQIEYSDVESDRDVWAREPAMPPPPTARNLEEIEYEPISLDEAVQLALSHSEVIRSVGARAYVSQATPTIYDPAILKTNPQIGPEAALAAFDAEFFTNLTVQRQERLINNQFFAGGLRDALIANEGNFSAGLRKVAATGTQFTVENLTNYSRNNAPANLFTSAYDTDFSLGFRHPLLRGGGIEFNRIAGPGAIPGTYRGVMIASINADIALSDFEAAIRDLMRDVERNYWELYFAYRNLDTSRDFRQYAVESWELEKRRVEAQMRPPDQEAFAREQFYQAQTAVENALSGTATAPGVLTAERNLRTLLGLTASDGRLLRPSTPPLMADLQYDWQESLQYSLVRRVELRSQRQRVRQRELELVASRNFRLPQVDFVGRYTRRGFGDNLMGDNSAYRSMLSWDLEGWVAGVEMRAPLGQRQGHAAVRNAELQLRRERAVLDEQERHVTMELRGAFTELDRAYAVTRSNYNRHIAAQVQLEAERERNAVGATRLDLVLEAQRRAVLAETQFHRSVVDYNLAVSQLNLVRGTLLDSLHVSLSEEPWSALADATALSESRRFATPRRPQTPAARPSEEAAPLSDEGDDPGDALPD